ncbi:MAG: glycosyltransferase family 4 protein [Magnetococcales bacterium]|nr:glycosyltransferase family 4 protein [Magnetococcales bacterium]
MGSDALSVSRPDPGDAPTISPSRQPAGRDSSVSPKKTSPLRIAQILPTMRRAGAESVVAALCRGLAALGGGEGGVEVHLVVVGHRFDYAEELAGSGVHCHFLDLYQGPVRFYRWDIHRRIRRKLGAFLGSLQSDIVHFHLAHGLQWGGEAALAGGARIFYTAHGMDPMLASTHWRARWRRRGFIRGVQQSRCRLLAVSANVALHLAKGLEIPAKTVTIQPNPIDLERWPGIRATPSAPPHQAIMVGTLYPLKRVDVGIRAVAAWSEEEPLRLIVVGDGSERDNLESLARAQGVSDRVTFLGVRRDVPEQMAKAGVAWLLSEREGMPMAALEAMASGVPLIATDVPGTRELIQEGVNGLLVPLDDPQAVVAATRKLQERPELLNRIISGGAATVSQYGLPQVAQRHLELYRESLNG